MEYEGIKALNFSPDGEILAVVANSDAAAQQLGHKRVSDTNILTLIVYHDGVEVFREEVGEGKYRSAIFVEAWIVYRGHERGLRQSIVFDQIALHALEQYMGARVWGEATDPQGSKHGFVRAVTSGQKKEVLVGVVWRGSRSTAKTI